MRRATFDLEDFLEQLQSVKKMGSISSFLEMVPGFSQISKKLPAGAIDESGLKKSEAIVRSMTLPERRDPDILNGSRRRRIAQGSGTTPQDVNQVLNQFRQAQKLMKQMTQGRGPRGLPKGPTWPAPRRVSAAPIPQGTLPCGATPWLTGGTVSPLCRGTACILVLWHLLAPGPDTVFGK